jgi:hypothetical protein
LITTASSLTTLAQSAAFDRQIAGLEAVLLRLPPGQRLFYDQPAFRSAGVGVDALRHLAAEYVALRGGDTAYNFAMFPHFVIRDRVRRTLATESTSYDIELRLVNPCEPASPTPGPLLASAGNWQAFAPDGPLVRPPSRPVDSLTPTPAC